MTISFTEHYRFGIPDFLSEPWHAEWDTLVRHIDRVLYQAIILNGAIPWSNSHLFLVGDIAIDPQDGVMWVCKVQHTSAATPVSFATDRNNNPSFWSLFANTPPINIEFIFDGGGGPITLGHKGDLEISFNAQIMKATLLANQIGNIEIDIYKDSYGNFPPLVGDSITGASKPTLLNATKSQDSTLLGWNRTINAGDILRFNVDTVSLVQRVTLSLECMRL